MTDETLTVTEADSDVLREQVEARKGPADKTVVVFKYTFEPTASKKHREYYSYAAIWIARQGKWYVTGVVSNAVPRELPHDDFMKILASRHVKKASVAAVFEQFKP